MLYRCECECDELVKVLIEGVRNGYTSFWMSQATNRGNVEYVDDALL
jgi:hypothetical protein